MEANRAFAEAIANGRMPDQAKADGGDGGPSTQLAPAEQGCGEHYG